MAHEAGPEFFQTKRPWSKYKDAILKYYLTPYLAKTSRLGRPIYLIDMFAGPGRFLNDQQDEGSPVILCAAAHRARLQGANVRVLLIEENKELFRHLCRNVEAYTDFVEARNADCTSVLDEVAVIAKRNTTFVYIDPYTMSGLHLQKLGSVYEAVKAGVSVEVLLAFFANELMRAAASCLAQEGILLDRHAAHMIYADDDVDPANAVALDSAALTTQRSVLTTRDELTKIAGGEYWRRLAEETNTPFSDRVQEFVAAYTERMRPWFSVVGAFPIRACLTDAGA